MSLALTLTTTSAMAQMADMITVRYNCKQAITSKNASQKQVITAQMLTGGFAGLTQIRVTKTSGKKKAVETYIVKQDNPKNAPIGGPSVYRGEDGMSFSINQTTNPMMSRKATLVENGQVTQLLCDLNKGK